MSQNITSFTPTTFSCEFFPPKTEEGVAHLYANALALAAWQPHFFSVTFGAGGSTREGTLETVKLLQQQTNISVAPHLSCLFSSREEIRTALKHYQHLGIKRLVALRGDQSETVRQNGDFNYASELVAFIRECSGDYFHIEVAAYPEIHPQALSVQEDILNLKRKYQAGANSAITQYFYNADAYFYYRDACQKQGIALPIIPGIMPILQFASIARFSNLCGAEIPLWLRKRLADYADDSAATKALGVEVIYNLCQTLIAGGVPSLHFYTLNKAEITMELLSLLGFSYAKAPAETASA